MVTVFNDHDAYDESFYNANFTSGNSSSSPIDNITNVPIAIPFLPLGLGIILVTVGGIFGNSLSAFILSKKRFRSSYSVLTLGLAVADTVYLLTKFIRYGLDSLFSHYGIFSFYTSVFHPILGPYLRAITFTAHTASTYLTMAIAFDRYMAICQPSKGRKFCTTKRAAVTGSILTIFAIFYNITRWFEFHTDSFEEFNGTENITRYSMNISELRKNPMYKLYYIFWAYFLVMFVIPFVTLSVLNFLIWRGVRDIQKSVGPNLSSFQSRENSFALMLIGVVTVFLICNLDYLVLDVMDYFGSYYSEFWSHLGNFLLTLNSAVNFLIYCICGRKFREEFGKLLGKPCTSCGWNKNTASHDINTSDGWHKGDQEQTTNIDMYHIRQK